MTTVTFDTQVAATRLRKSGFTEEQADAIIETLRNAHAELATRADLERVVRDLRDSLLHWIIGLVLPIYALLFGLLYAIVLK